MARPQKRGLDYFPLDTVLDVKFDLIEAEFSLTGFAVIIKLLQKIYAEQGYYCEYTNEVALLFAKKIGLGGSVVSEIISAAIKRGIFNASMFEKYQVLTSVGIQTRYFEAVSRRNITVEGKYLLISSSILSDNVTIVDDNACINAKNVSNNSTKEKKQKDIKSNNIKPKQKSDSVVDVVVQYYENNIGIISTAIYGDIKSYRDKGVSDEVLCRCIEIAVFANKRQWSYVKGILNNLLEKGIFTMELWNSQKPKPVKETASYDINELSEFWDTVPKL